MVAVMPGDDGDEQTPGILFLTYRLAYTRAHALTLTLQHTLSHSHSLSHSRLYIGMHI